DLGMRVTLAPARDGDEVRSIGRAEANHGGRVGIERMHFQRCFRLRRANAEVARKRTRLPHLQIATDAEIPDSELFTALWGGYWRERGGIVVEVARPDFLAIDAVVMVSCHSERDFAFGNSGIRSNMGIGNRCGGNFRCSDRVILEMLGVDRRKGEVRRGDTTSSNPATRNLDTFHTTRMVVRPDVFS